MTTDKEFEEVPLSADCLWKSLRLLSMSNYLSMNLPKVMNFILPEFMQLLENLCQFWFGYFKPHVILIVQTLAVCGALSSVETDFVSRNISATL